MTRTPRRIVDAAGRAWDVYEFTIWGGVSRHVDVGSGSGSYRGFAPVDRGARRQYLMKLGENHVPVTDELLLEQLAQADLDRRDDPAAQASYGRLPERVDPTP